MADSESQPNGSLVQYYSSYYGQVLDDSIDRYLNLDHFPHECRQIPTSELSAQNPNFNFVLCNRANLICESACSENAGLSLREVYQRENRQQKLKRYLKKKQSRKWNKKVAYICRQKVAQDRLRVKGRFTSVRKEVPALEKNKETKVSESTQCSPTVISQQTEKPDP